MNVLLEQQRQQLLQSQEEEEDRVQRELDQASALQYLSRYRSLMHLIHSTLVFVFLFTRMFRLPGSTLHMVI